jgi:hypothetical protein
MEDFPKLLSKHLDSKIPLCWKILMEDESVYLRARFSKSLEFPRKDSGDQNSCAGIRQYRFDPTMRYTRMGIAFDTVRIGTLARCLSYSFLVPVHT